jgi:hypothetical protein
MDKAQVYAKALNIELESASPTSVDLTAIPAISEVLSTAQPASVMENEPPAVQAPANNELVVDDASVTDYVQRYNEIVLGERPVNAGNVVLVVLIALALVGGGSFVVYNEIKLRDAAAQTRAVDGEYPADVVAMLPAVSALNVKTRRALSKLLKQPAKAEKVMSLLDTLAPDDKESTE